MATGQTPESWPCIGATTTTTTTTTTTATTTTTTTTTTTVLIISSTGDVTPGTELEGSAIYVMSEGPRFETRAEIREYRSARPLKKSMMIIIITVHINKQR